MEYKCSCGNTTAVKCEKCEKGVCIKCGLPEKVDDKIIYHCSNHSKPEEIPEPEEPEPSAPQQTPNQSRLKALLSGEYPTIQEIAMILHSRDLSAPRDEIIDKFLNLYVEDLNGWKQQADSLFSSRMTTSMRNLGQCEVFSDDLENNINFFERTYEMAELIERYTKTDRNNDDETAKLLKDMRTNTPKATGLKVKAKDYNLYMTDHLLLHAAKRGIDKEFNDTVMDYNKDLATTMDEVLVLLTDLKPNISKFNKLIEVTDKVAGEVADVRANKVEQVETQD